MLISRAKEKKLGGNPAAVSWRIYHKGKKGKFVPVLN
jgi:hypothetical protein